MATMTTLLPGEDVPSSQFPKSKKGTLTLGPGLRHVPPSTILATTAGSLQVDHKKSALWLEFENGRYQPAVGDLVIAQVHHTGSDHFFCSLTPHTPHALLGQLAFEGASKKTRPNLKSGDIVYGRITKASKWEDTELECINPSGKADGMGQLKEGMLFHVSHAFARRLMMGTDKSGHSKGAVVILEEMGEKIRFEVAVGRNGKVWINSSSVKETVMIGRLLTTADEEHWDVEQQKKAVKKALQDA
ncbi:Hypothetical protein R9X50_00448700 [Acrodontium crateriforme]|uniref:Ribosomal RNA-processing protein 40 n=1 Tax=Acrodontium crateriforme TaxID=150365 RepID=A0AAQ3MB22_9PEZI|nr:Hypothetical protein R9X50_00448700 [Acrodontium crateriforme]